MEPTAAMTGKTSDVNPNLTAECESWGVGERFGLVDSGRGRTYWFATKNAAHGEPEEPEGRKAEILLRFSGWHEPIATVAEARDESAILREDAVVLAERLAGGDDLGSALAEYEAIRRPRAQS